MKMKNSILVFAVFLVIFYGCKKDKNDDPLLIIKDAVSGNSQKGPFVNGSSLEMFELDNNFVQTGKTFSTQILDNSGSFEILNISLVSNYVKLKAEGFYYNEVKNITSQAPITLFALSDVSNKSTVNVNILTHLEVSRTEYLINNGLSFNDAKAQAQEEILDIFSISKSDITDSELLNISQAGDDNAILLAISVIIQGYRNESDLTQLLGDMATDIRTDGVLNSPVLGTMLINDVTLMNLADIRNNLETKYLSMGVNATVPDFEKYINIFLDSSNYVFNNYIQYPYIILSKENLLADTTFPTVSLVEYMVGAYLPYGTSLKLLIKPTPGFGMSGFAYSGTGNDGWTINNYFGDSLVFTASGMGQTVSVPVMWGPPTSIDFFFYENNSPVPTRIKTVAV